MDVPLGCTLKSPFDVDEGSLGSIFWRYSGRGLFDPLRVPTGL
jgi:hypothetical protein